MRGFILAAGFGTRLKPLTEHIPKALVPAGGMPLLARSLQFLKRNGIYKIGVNAHYLPEQLEEFRKSSQTPFSLFIEEGEIRGTGGAFHFAKDFLYEEDSFLVINVDIISSIDINPLIKKFKESDLSCALLSFKATGQGTIFYDRKTHLYLGTKSDRGSFPDSTGSDFIGAALYRKEFLEIVNENDFSIVPVWSRAAECGMKVGVIELEQGYWKDIGTPTSLAEFHFDLLDKNIEMQIPSNLSIDYERKICYPSTMEKGDVEKLGQYTWIENAGPLLFKEIQRSVVFDDAGIRTDDVVENSIVTKWGSISLK
jgi:mannose-1-phosphate guanylyltransferase